MFGSSGLAYAQYNYVGGYYGTGHGNTVPPVQAFLNNIASYSSKKTFTYDYPKDLILYFERFKFLQPGHLSLNLDARKINHTFIA